MLKSILNKLFEKRSFRIILSLLISVCLWAYVEYVENPDTQVLIAGIPVEFTGTDELAANNLIVTENAVNTVNIRFSGKRNMVAGLSSKDLSVTVDLTDILTGSGPQAGVYQLSYAVNYPSEVSGIVVADASQDYITVTVEKLITRTLDVKPCFNGDIADDYRAKDPVSSIEEVTVSGSQNIVSSLDYAQAEVTGTQISRTIEQETALTFVDTDGNKVDSSLLTLSQETAVVTVQVQMIKEVTFAVNLVEGASATEKNTTLSYSTTSIKLAGDPEDLEDMNQIVLGTVDLTDFASSTSYTFPVTIPNGAENLTGVSSVTVSVEVVGMSTKRLTGKNITVKAVTEGYTATVVTQNLDVLLRGSESSLAAVTADNIRIAADLTSIGNAVGTFTVPAKVSVDGQTDIDPIGEYKVVVTVAQADAAAQAGS